MVELHLNVLEAAKKRTKRKFLELLDNLPPVLEETYEQLWLQLVEQADEDVLLAKSVLTWLCYAIESLEISALRHALASSEPGILYVDDDDLVTEEEIVAVCLGLISVRTESKKVRFVHGTAEEFFPSYLTKTLHTAHFDLARSCIQYLSLSVFSEWACSNAPELDDILLRYPFLPYAATQWGNHARKAPENNLVDLILGLLNQAGNRNCAACLLLTFGNCYEDFVPHPWVTINGLDLACFFGLQVTVAALLDSGHHVDSQDSSGWTPLRWAVYGKQTDITNQLLRAGTDMTLKDGNGDTTLMWVLGRRHAVLRYEQIYISGDSRVHIGDRIATYGLASAGSHIGIIPDIRSSKSVVNILIQATENVDFPICRERTVLLQASENHQLQIVSLLVERGADINRRDEEGMNPLLWALHYPRVYRYFSRVYISDESKVLLGDSIALHPATTLSNVQSPALYTDQYALTQKEEDVIRSLIGSDLETTDVQGRTALSLAMESHSPKLVNHLLDLGARIDSTDRDDLTPLMWACKQPRPSKTCFTEIYVSDNATAICGTILNFHDLAEYYDIALKDHQTTEDHSR